MKRASTAFNEIIKWILPFPKTWVIQPWIQTHNYLGNHGVKTEAHKAFHTESMKCFSYWEYEKHFIQVAERLLFQHTAGCSAKAEASPGNENGPPDRACYRILQSPNSCLWIMHASERRQRAQLHQMTFSDYKSSGLHTSLRLNIMEQMTVLYISFKCQG